MIFQDLPVASLRRAKIFLETFSMSISNTLSLFLHQNQKPSIYNPSICSLKGSDESLEIFLDGLILSMDDVEALGDAVFSPKPYHESKHDAFVKLAGPTWEADGLVDGRYLDHQLINGKLGDFTWVEQLGLLMLRYSSGVQYGKQMNET
jgi:hypothetical protein